ncbi:MAG: hypothetical protein AB7O74_09785 [Candidatus Nanopelagicales bacterium]
MSVLPGLPGRPSGCLGDRVADLADGRMAPADAETAYAHVAVCDRCRLALDAERSAAAALASDTPGPSDDLMARLLGIPAAEAAAARPFAPPVVPTQAGVRPSGSAGVRPAAAPGPSRPPRSRRRVRVAMGSAAGAAALAVAAVVGGAPAAIGGASPSPAPQFAPVIDALADEHSASTQRMPFSGPLVITAAFDSRSSSTRP